MARLLHRSDFGYIPDPSIMVRAEDEESDIINDMSCDNAQDGERRRRSHRHTAYQIQELEMFVQFLLH